MKHRNICAVFGEGPEELSFGYDEEYYTCAVLKMRLVRAMQAAIADGCTAFASTLDEGVPMWGAEACLAMGGASLIAVPTLEEQASRWHPERRERYFRLIEECDTLVDAFTEGLTAEEYILEGCSHAIILGGLEHSRIRAVLDAARRADIKVLYIPSA